MKTNTLVSLITLLSFLGGIVTAEPLGTTFTYQGRLADGGNPANGSYDLTFTLFDSNNDGSAIAGPLTNSAVAVSNGLFTITLDFGASAFTGEARWLEIGARANGSASDFTLLSPRQPVTPTPYALHALSSASASNAAAVAVGAIGTEALQDGAVTASKVAAGQLVTSLNGLRDEVVLAAGANVSLATNGNTITLSAVGGYGGASNAWFLTGNSGTTEGTHFLGSLDLVPLELRVNNTRVVKYWPDAQGPNILAGYSGNALGSGLHGATISGGGVSGAINSIYAGAHYSAIGGGKQNVIKSSAADPSDCSTIAGGTGNLVGYGANQATMGGGTGNSVGDGSDYSTISGGALNTISNAAYSSSIAGGRENRIAQSAAYASVGGGLKNLAAQNYGTVSGGYSNIAGGAIATIGGGLNNRASASYDTVAGGYGNVGSGGSSTVAGGSENSASANSAFVGGGWNNVASGIGAVVAGGGYDGDTWRGNRAAGNGSFIGGGVYNSAPDKCATISGGQLNTAGWHGTVGGGLQNTAGGHYSTVPGGYLNEAVGDYSLAVGQRAKANHAGAFVWADTQAADFASSANNQFLIRAAGNVGINKNNPATALDVSGTVTATAFAGSGASMTGVNADLLDGQHGLFYQNAGNMNAGILPDARLSPNVALLNSSPTFTGTVTAGADLVGSRLKVGTSHSLAPPGASIAGGDRNSVYSGGTNSTIAGGVRNDIRAPLSTIGGGEGNWLKENAAYAFIGGGQSNSIGPIAVWSAIGGGLENSVQGTNLACVIGGGWHNTIEASEFLIPFLSCNTIGGGHANSVGNLAEDSTIGGGEGNRILSGVSSGTIPGGKDNVVGDDYAFAAGRGAFATNYCAFVWNSDATNFGSVTPMEFAVNAPGGFRFFGLQDVGNRKNVQWASDTGVVGYETSSRRFKQNIQVLQDNFGQLLKTQPAIYTRPGNTNRWEIGYIAEEFDEVGLKRLVDYDAEGRPEGIQYDRICLYLTEIVKQQEAEIASLKAENVRMVRDLADLKAMMKTLADKVNGGAQ